MAKQAERRQATGAAIIAAATELFGKQGFAATSVDHIAAAAKVAKGAVYHHFPTTDAIFEAVFDRVCGEVAEKVFAAARAAPDVLSGIAIGTKAYFKLCSRGAVGRIVLGDGPAVLGWQRWRELDGRHFGAVIPAALQAAMAQGLIAPQPVEPMARLLLGAVTEAAVATANSGNPGKAGQLHAEALERLLLGLRRRGAGEP
ncbi:MAG: TetR/AcrR family transcriptional regulator [Xanthobacteraceae bacterium]